jgi:predicted cobalt transporter CbtA
MMRTLLVRGMLAGLLAGVVAAVFAYLVGEPHVDAAISFEEANAHDHGGEGELVSRSIQRTLGLFVGVGGYGLAVGGLFSIAFAFLYGRVGPATARGCSLATAAGGFVVVILVPFLKYPGNPPAVGQEGTAASRTQLYFGFLALSVLAAVLALYAGRHLADRIGAWAAWLSATLGYAIVMAGCAAILPAVEEVPENFPATTLWSFRIASLGTHAILWTTLGIAFGLLADRALKSQRAVVTSA